MLIIEKEDQKVITKRFSDISTELLNKFFNGKKAELAKTLGVKAQHVHLFIKTERSLTPQHINNLITATNLNLKWLLGDDSEEKYLKNEVQPKKSDMEEMHRLNAKIKRLEGDAENYKKRIEELLFEIEALKRDSEKKEVG